MSTASIAGRIVWLLVLLVFNEVPYPGGAGTLVGTATLSLACFQQASDIVALVFNAGALSLACFQHVLWRRAVELKTEVS